MPKLFSSTFFWARSTDLLSMPASSTSPSLWPNMSIALATRSEAKRRMRLSSREMKKTDEPGSPWRPARPRSWRSTRRLSWRSVPMMANPPALRTSGESLMSVPRPAMFVAMVTVPSMRSSVRSVPSGSVMVVVPIALCPAWATMSASRRWSLALSTLCGILRMLSMRLSSSEISTEVVPTSEGRPSLRVRTISSMTALYFSRFVL